MSVVAISEDSFEADVIKSGTPVLLDFWAEWCGPCKATAPILDEISGQYEGRVKIAKVNVDDNGELAARFNVRGVPTLIFFKDGEAIASKPGMFSKSQLIAFIDSNL